MSLLHKLRVVGVTGEVLAWFKCYLLNRKQRVVLPGAVSDWTSICGGVPQGSLIGPLLFLLYINDIVTDFGLNIRLFADDTSLYIVVDNPVEAANSLNNDLDNFTQWAARSLVSFNPTKTESIIISRFLNRIQHPLYYAKSSNSGSRLSQTPSLVYIFLTTALDTIILIILKRRLGLE